MKLFLLHYITLFSSLYLQLLICTDIRRKNSCLSFPASGLCVMGTHLPALVTIISVPSWLNSSHKAFISN